MDVTVKVTLYCGDSACSNINSFLRDYVIETFCVSSESSFDEVFQKCAKKCNISPLYHNLFALRDDKLNWVNLRNQLDSYIEQTDDVINLEFRVRFTFKSECENGETKKQSHRRSSPDTACKPVMNEKVVKYFFHQQHDDFLNGNLKFNKEIIDETGAALGVAVLDLLRLACEMRSRLDTTLGRLRSYKKLLPASCRQKLRDLSLLNRLRVDLKFKHYLRHFTPNCSQWMDSNFESQSIGFFYSRYLRNLELVVENNHIETFEVLPALTSVDSCSVTIGGDCGIVLSDQKEKSSQWCDFHEITHMRLKSINHVDEEVWIVSISKLSGKIIDLAFNSLAAAQNFASGVNGYYRLVTDAHHYLCEIVTAPSVVKLLSLNCHGPISCAYAEFCLKNRPQVREGDCLLRQSQESMYEYFINTVIEVLSNSDAIVRNYKLDIEEGKLGIFGDQESHMYDDVAALLDAYSRGQHQTTLVPFNLDNLLSPTSKSQGILKVFRCSDALSVNSKSQDSNIPILRESDYSFQRNLGYGKFTTVRLHKLISDKDKKVVIKRVYDPDEAEEITVKSHVQGSFLDSICKQYFLKNDYIVEQIGLMQNMSVLDYVPYGSITEYSQTHRLSQSSDDSNCTSYSRQYGWYWQVLWQLTHACNYLEEKGYAHGNIRGKNVLLQKMSPAPYIKLADSGLRTTREKVDHGNEFANHTVALLPAPWLAREFCWIGLRPASDSTYPTIEADKWSFATTACEICDSENFFVQPGHARNIGEDLQHRYLTGNVMPIPAVLSTSDILKRLIMQCWSECPQKRPNYKIILRELGAVLSSDYIVPTFTRREESSPDENPFVLPDLQRFEDTHLVHICKVGQGHFGKVDLYRYDAPGINGRWQVAVKSFLTAVNNPSRDAEFNHEIETMRRLDNKHVVKLLGVAEPSLRIVMEYLPLGSLSNYLTKNHNQPFSYLYDDLLNFSRQIAEGMIAVQEQNLIHRDLALRNILLAQDPVSHQRYVKISDFGLSRILRDKTYYRGNPNAVPAKWYAPECLDDHGNSFQYESDIWSYGVTIWEMFSCGAIPKYNVEVTSSTTALYKVLREGHRLPKPRNCPLQIYSLMFKCWEFEPKQRPNFHQLRDWFADPSLRNLPTN